MRYGQKLIIALRQCKTFANESTCEKLGPVFLDRGCADALR
jgi:hypothetical protein